MPRIEIPFTGQANKAESYMMSPQECVNLYPVLYNDIDGEKMALLGIPGLELWKRLSPSVFHGEVRAMLTLGNYLFIVGAGRVYYTTTGADSITELGNISYTDKLSMATNGTDIIIVCGSLGYVIKQVEGVITLSRIMDADFPGGDTVAYIDGYYLVNRPGTGQIWRSAYNDGSSWDGLAFSTAGSDTDNIRAIIVDHRDIIIFGEWTTEIWYNTGEATFNFARIEGAMIEQGIASSYAVTRINNAVFFLGSNKSGKSQVFQISGRAPTIISNTSLDSKIRDYDSSSAFMFSYQQNGHFHTVLTFPLDGKTWVYDSTTSLWHERSSTVKQVLTRWRPNCIALFEDALIVGDFLDGRMYKLNPDLYQDETYQGNTPIIAKRVTPIIRNKQSRITVNEIQVFMEPGVGISHGQDWDKDPQMLLSWSKDGGRTWAGSEKVSMGKIGEVDNVSRVTQLGQGINWVFKVEMGANVKRVILGAIADIEEDYA